MDGGDIVTLPAGLIGGESGHVTWHNELHRVANRGHGLLVVDVTEPPYGAVGDGVADDSGPVQAANDAVEAAGAGVVFFPGGRFRLASGITTSGAAGVAWIGVSSGSNTTFTGGSEIVSDVASGIAVDVNTGTSVKYGFCMKHLKFRGGGAESTLFRASYPLDGLIFDCKFINSAGVGVDLGRAQNVKFLGNEITNCQSWGLKLTNGNDGNAGQTCRIDNSTIKGNGLSGDNTGGIYLATGGEHLVTNCVIESHTNTTGTRGILVESVRHIIANNIFEWNEIPIQWGTTGGTASFNSKVHDNQIIGGKMLFAHYAGEDFHHNTLGDHTSGLQWSVQFDASATQANATTRWRENLELPAGINARITDNTPAAGGIEYEGSWDNVSTNGRRTFVDGDTTPAVYGFRFFHANNSAPTTITGFDGGYEGKVIVIRAVNGNTTIQDGTGIFLSGSANYTMATTSTLTLVHEGNDAWYEVSRSVN